MPLYVQYNAPILQSLNDYTVHALLATFSYAHWLQVQVEAKDTQLQQKDIQLQQNIIQLQQNDGQIEQLGTELQEKATQISRQQREIQMLRVCKSWLVKSLDQPKG